MAFLDETGLQRLVEHIKSEIAAVVAEKSHFENATIENNLSVGGSLTVDGREYGVNKVLWAGEAFMSADQTVTLSEAVSAQPHGIFLVWGIYENGNVQNHGRSCHFIPKSMIDTSFDLPLHRANFTQNGVKYLVLTNTAIYGDNVNTSYGTYNGITYANGYWALTRVIGV